MSEQKEMIWVGVWKCQPNHLDEVVTADCSKRAEQPQQTSGHQVMSD